MMRINSLMFSMGLTVAGAVHAGSPSSAVPAMKQAAADPAVIAAVREHNARGLSLEQIKQTDASWSESDGALDAAETAMNNAAADRLAVIEADTPYLVEAILTGNQGANVAITAVTSDYWQGDEPKFVRSFSDGAGAVFIDRPKRDQSTGEVTAQVSVPVMDNGKAIGTLTWGVLVDQLP